MMKNISCLNWIDLVTLSQLMWQIFNINQLFRINLPKYHVSVTYITPYTQNEYLTEFFIRF